MGKKYEKEFKLMIVELLQSGRPCYEVSSEYSLNESMIRRWRREYESDKPCFTGKGVASLTAQELEIKELKKQLRNSQMEVEILKKVMGIVFKSESKNTI